MAEINIFTGGKGGAGKTLCALCTSTYFLTLTRKVLLVDLNLFNHDLYWIMRRLSREAETQDGKFTFAKINDNDNALLVAPQPDIINHYQLPMGAADVYKNYLNELFGSQKVRNFIPEICLVDTGFHIANLMLPDNNATERSWLPENEANHLAKHTLNIWFLWTLNVFKRHKIEKDAIEHVVRQLDAINIGKFRNSDIAANRHGAIRHVFNPHDLYSDPSFVQQLEVWKPADALHTMVKNRQPPGTEITLSIMLDQVMEEIKEKKGDVSHENWANIICETISKHTIPENSRPKNFFPMLRVGGLKSYITDLTSEKQDLELVDLQKKLGAAYEKMKEYLLHYYG